MRHALGIPLEALEQCTIHLMLRILLQLVLWTALLGVLIFWPAGTLDYPGAWVLLALYALGGLAMILWLSKHDPRLLRERMASPVKSSSRPRGCSTGASVAT